MITVAHYTNSSTVERKTKIKEIKKNKKNP